MQNKANLPAVQNSGKLSFYKGLRRKSTPYEAIKAKPIKAN
jgi:hypothetical protein